MMTDLVEQEQEQEKSVKPKKLNWWWPAALANSLAGAVVVAFGGCFHSRMSWPVRVKGYSYQICLSCGAKRLFNEGTFVYGPFRYDLDEPIASKRSTKPEVHPLENLPHPTL